MRLNTKTRYGIRALYDLGCHGRGGEATQAKEIAARQQIPLRYLEQVLQDLRRAGIVEAKRGPRGGYALARAAEAVKLGDVLRAVEGPLEDRFAVADGDGADNAAAQVVWSDVWRELTGKVIDVLDGVTLRDFIARAEAAGEKPAAARPMYFI
jgi:Rrf2 family protein